MWIEVFKSGKHKSSQGIEKFYSDDDIRKIAKIYNEKQSETNFSEAPLVKGHPVDNAPALGWVENLAVKGNKLLAKIKDINKELIEEIRDKKFKKVSISLYPDLMLRHIGILGAGIPSVKGLKPVSFNENEDFLEFEEKYEKGYNFIDTNDLELIDLKNQVQKLEYENQLLRKNTRLSEFRESAGKILNKNRKLTPKGISELIDIFENIHFIKPESSDKIINQIVDFVENIEFDEFTDKLNLNEKLSEFNYTNPERTKVHNKAKEIQSGNPGLSYEEAVLEAQSYFIN